MMHFEDLYASPARSDASSVDIYDDLDTDTLTEDLTKPSSPSRDCLDLYEEIITEEGTAKEASLNDLSAEYEKCQRQMKQMIIKLKEMQSVNTSLQSENHCLKKNISALIKTARVEITRKEEEINRLNQRLFAPGNTRRVNSVPVLLQGVNKTKDVTSKIASEEDHIRKEVKPQESSKDVSLNYSPINITEKMKARVETNSLSTEITQSVKQCKESAQSQLQKQSLGLNTEVDKKNRKEMDSEGQNTERRQRKEGQRSSMSSSTSENSVVKEKTRPISKCGKSEGYQEGKNSKSVVCSEIDNRKNNLSSRDKSSATKDKVQLSEPLHSKDKPIKVYEKSCRKDPKVHERVTKVEHRRWASEKDDEPRSSNRKHFSNVKDESYQKAPSFEKNDSRRSSDARRREKRSSEYSESKCGIKESKSSKADLNTASINNKHNREKKSDKSDLDRRGDEKKRSREEHDRSRHDRKHRVHQKGEKEISEPSSKDKCEELLCKTDVKSMNNEKDFLGHKEVQKDLKLSFMETLSLTLSPAKKKSDTDPTTSTVSKIECGVNEETFTTDLSFHVCESTEIVANSPKHLSPKQADSKHREPKSGEVPTKAVALNDSKLVCLSEPVVANAVYLQEEPPTSTHDDNIAALANMTLEDNQVVFIELDAVSSEEIERQSVVDGSDFIDLDSFIEIDKCSGSESPNSENLTVSLPIEHAQDGGVLEQACEDVDKISNLKPNITETTKDLPSDVHTSTPCLSLSMELNKENCEPVIKTNLGSEFSVVISSDEVEEGEIVSEEELIGEQALQSISTTSQTNIGKELYVSKITSSPESESISLANSKTPKPLVSKIKKKDKSCTQTKSSPLSKAKRKKLTADSCLEGVLKIIPPSSIQDVLQMLRIIRKHIRKKYMKFKIQFPVTQFHRIIEAATLCFITLVSNLDWSNLCSSPQRLQNKLCKHIDNKLKQLKKNGIVDRIFDQHLLDMKKRLWKFVEEQLDSLFDTLKDILLKRCDKDKIENYNDPEQKTNTASCARALKSDHVKNAQKSHSLKTKAGSAKSSSVPCLRRLEFCTQTKVSNTKIQSADGTSVGNKLLKDSTRVGCLSDHGNLVCNSISPTSKYSPASTGKTVISTGLQKGQQNSSGLSFNLVSDDHMGDIFKSLLHDPNQLEINTLQENLWLYGTPEKQCSSIQKYENVDSMGQNKTPTKTHFSWSSISPPHINTLPRMETVLNPDVFDESCLLEIPTSKCITSSEDRLHSYSSVLLEDLAVSLTVPSPLKSDSHLSFLRPVCEPESISDGNAHCSEDALLDGEDAIEQDIHLTLDSDNSCTGSLENVGEPGSFHCHPSEPMQAVIMEKSNDHFIVKIRRAVSASSPLSDCSSVDETANDASGQLETVECSTFCENAQTDVQEMETLVDAKSEAHSDSVVLCTVGSSFSDIGVETFTCLLPDSKNPSETMESVFKSPENISQNLTCTLETTTEIEVTDANYVEKDQIDSDKNYTENTISIPVTYPDVSPVNPDSDCMDFSLIQKKRKLSNEEHSSKRQKLSPLYNTKAKNKAPRQSKDEEGMLLVMEKAHRKHKRAVSDGAINSKHSPSSLSAKNVIKKKGEVVVSWTRDEDRAILLECQKLGPKEKTFLALSSKMNKYPHQVEERFRQLMKLFKKSRNCSS